MPEREQADEAQQDLDSSGDDLQVNQVGEHIEDKHSAFVLGIKVVVKRHRIADRFHHLGVIALIFHDDRRRGSRCP